MKWIKSPNSVLILFLTTILQGIAQPNYPLQPEQAQLITSDIKNFLEAYEQLTIESDTIQILQTHYFDGASVGLKEYISRFSLNANDLSKSIAKFPDDYQKIRSFYNEAETTKIGYINELIRYKEVLPQAMFPPTYLIVADHKGIAQASKYGQLISIELKYTDNSEALKNTCVHELTHFQQAMTMGIQKYTGMYSKENNMLDMILREGTAEFITYKLVRKNPEQFKKLSHYEADEMNLWKKFQADLKSQASDYWLNVTYDDNNKGVPIQMGYGLGYKIVEAYYNKQEDKNQALKDILMMEDVTSLYQQSGYQGSN